jgi:hypothetical protein
MQVNATTLFISFPSYIYNEKVAVNIKAGVLQSEKIEKQTETSFFHNY